MNKKQKIIVVLTILALGPFVYLLIAGDKSKRYEDLYPWMKGWSNTKKEFFKLYRFRAVANWYMGEGGYMSQQEAENRARWHWTNGDEKQYADGDIWPQLWEQYRTINGLNENGF